MTVHRGFHCLIDFHSRAARSTVFLDVLRVLLWFDSTSVSQMIVTITPRPMGADSLANILT
jgi:hypothetical protein